MEIIDRYVHEVGQHLPRRLRADVQAELRSLLTDAVEERARAAGRPADGDLARQVLGEFGPPQKVAAGYAPQPQYLIGPTLFPTYTLTVRVVVGAIAALFLAFLVVGVLASLRGPASAPNARVALHVIGTITYAAFFNFGLITLVFAIVERVQAHREAEASVWTPAMLPPLDDPERISPFGMVAGMYLIVALAVLFNFFPEWVVAGIRFHSEQGLGLVSILLPQFAIYMPFLNVFWALDFFLNLSVLRHGRWRRTTRWAEFALGLLGAGLLYAMIAGPPVFRFDYIVKAILKGVFAIMVAASALRLYRLLTRKPLDAWPSPPAETSRERQG